jgi:hypothetical protein
MSSSIMFCAHTQKKVLCIFSIKSVLILQLKKCLPSSSMLHATCLPGEKSHGLKWEASFLVTSLLNLLFSNNLIFASLIGAVGVMLFFKLGISMIMNDIEFFPVHLNFSFYESPYGL